MRHKSHLSHPFPRDPSGTGSLRDRDLSLQDPVGIRTFKESESPDLSELSLEPIATNDFLAYASIPQSVRRICFSS